MRSHFNRSALVRHLSGWLPAPADLPRQDLAERLGAWLNVADAIALHSAHQSLPSTRVRRPAARKAAPDLRADLLSVRVALTQAFSTPPQTPTLATDTEFAHHHQRYLDQQRRMEMAIDALRGHVRQTLATTSAALAQLAALDATLEPMFGAREQKLLASVPAFLKARLGQLQQAQPEAWPPRFEQALQHTLLAELDLRLQPVVGMIETFEHAGHAPHRVNP